jgi:putative PIN family toxin of toxin-antitoxin system
MNIEENKEKRPLLRIVLDTNIFISAFHSTNGLSGRAWQLACKRQYKLVTSPYIVAEVAGTLRRHFSWSEEKIVRRLKQISRAADIIQPTTSIRIVRDPKDDAIIDSVAESSLSFCDLR